ncbi:MAG TPA: hypothetical protein VFV63_09480 [Ilumatobacteraceae bacterium]|nr:hypothetical protein [Ilumatobacteraceae bacterium]
MVSDVVATNAGQATCRAPIRRRSMRTKPGWRASVRVASILAPLTPTQRDELARLLGALAASVEGPVRV